MSMVAAQNAGRAGQAAKSKQNKVSEERFASLNWLFNLFKFFFASSVSVAIKSQDERQGGRGDPAPGQKHQ